MTRELGVNEQTYDEEKESLSDYPPSSPSVKSTASSQLSTELPESPRSRKRDRGSRQKSSIKKQSLSKKLTEEVIHEEEEQEEQEEREEEEE